MVSGRSAARATWYGLPLSSDSSCASSSACFSIRSASRFISTPRCDAEIFLRHGPFSNAARAAATALSTSGASASATCVITSPVAGLIVGNVLPELLSTHLPLIRSLFALTFTVGSITVVAVAIMTSEDFFFAERPFAGSANPPLALAIGWVQGKTPRSLHEREACTGATAYTSAPSGASHPRRSLQPHHGLQP